MPGTESAVTVVPCSVRTAPMTVLMPVLSVAVSVGTPVTPEREVEEKGMEVDEAIVLE